jgi:hypothetical protein
MECRTVMDFIRTAYDVYANSQRRAPGRGVPIEGGPGWIDSDLYTINAVAEGTPAKGPDDFLIVEHVERPSDNWDRPAMRVGALRGPLTNYIPR